MIELKVLIIKPLMPGVPRGELECSVDDDPNGATNQGPKLQGLVKHVKFKYH